MRSTDCLKKTECAVRNHTLTQPDVGRLLIMNGSTPLATRKPVIYPRLGRIRSGVNKLKIYLQPPAKLLAAIVTPGSDDQYHRPVREPSNAKHDACKQIENIVHRGFAAKFSRLSRLGRYFLFLMRYVCDAASNLLLRIRASRLPRGDSGRASGVYFSWSCL